MICTIDAYPRCHEYLDKLLVMGRCATGKPNFVAQLIFKGHLHHRPVLILKRRNRWLSWHASKLIYIDIDIYSLTQIGCISHTVTCSDSVRLLLSQCIGALTHLSFTLIWRLVFTKSYPICIQKWLMTCKIDVYNVFKMLDFASYWVSWNQSTNLIIVQMMTWMEDVPPHKTMNTWGENIKGKM